MAKEQWPEVRIGDLGEVYTGRTPSTERASYFGKDYPFITPGDMHQGKYVRQTDRSLSHEGAELLKRIRLPANSICVSCIGWQMGEVIMTDRPSFTNQQINTIVPNQCVEPSFLYYSLRPRKQELLSLGAATGVRTPILNKSAFCELKVMLPPLLLQRRIAGILSAYDDLIENSQRRIRILETMARALYREWFVHFRFPGHEGSRRVSSPLGEIPEGWEVIPFERLLLSMSGGDWGSEQPNEEECAEVVIVRGTDFDEVAYGGDLRSPTRYIKPSSLKSRKLQTGDVIVENSINAKSRCVGTPLLVDEHVLNRLERDAVAASFCKVFRFHDASLAPVVHLHLCYLREARRMEYYQNVAANGIGNFQAQKFAKEEHLVLPHDPNLRARFIGKIGILMDKVSLLASQIQNLRRTRDLLLPRLLSDQVNLEALAA